jgi:DNA-binding transcriptional ArsR family regulator
MPHAPTEKIDQRLVRALAHPLRVRILEILSERVASPNVLSKELGVDLGDVAYHTRTLDRCGCLELVDTAKRRGATEHFYKAAPRTTLTWMPLELDEQGWDEVASILEEAHQRVITAQRRSVRRRGGRGNGAGSIAAFVALANFETRGSEEAAPSEPPPRQP